MKPEILKCIVVDSSSEQLMNVASLVDSHSKLTLVEKYCNVLEARNGIKNSIIDLIFLQVDMPIISGFDLLDSIPHKPQVILSPKTRFMPLEHSNTTLPIIYKNLLVQNVLIGP